MKCCTMYTNCTRVRRRKRRAEPPWCFLCLGICLVMILLLVLPFWLTCMISGVSVAVLIVTFR